jgi:hypothetical protein
LRDTKTGGLAVLVSLGDEVRHCFNLQERGTPS